MHASAHADSPPTHPFDRTDGSADESRYYGTRVTVVTHGETVKTFVIKVYNGGSLIEVHDPLCPGDLFASFRVSGEQVTQIDELVDRKVTPDAPLPKAEGAPPLVAQLQEVIQQWGGLNVYARTGAKLAYGPGCYGLYLADHMVAATNTYKIQLRDGAGEALSDWTIIPTFADCSKNLIIANFAQSQ